jgi:hypothetical protein
MLWLVCAQNFTIAWPQLTYFNAIIAWGSYYYYPHLHLRVLAQEGHRSRSAAPFG